MSVVIITPEQKVAGTYKPIDWLDFRLDAVSRKMARGFNPWMLYAYQQAVCELICESESDNDIIVTLDEIDKRINCYPQDARYITSLVDVFTKKGWRVEVADGYLMFSW